MSTVSKVPLGTPGWHPGERFDEGEEAEKGLDEAGDLGSVRREESSEVCARTGTPVTGRSLRSPALHSVRAARFLRRTHRETLDTRSTTPLLSGSLALRRRCRPDALPTGRTTRCDGVFLLGV